MKLSKRSSSRWSSLPSYFNNSTNTSYSKRPHLKKSTSVAKSYKRMCTRAMTNSTRRISRHEAAIGRSGGAYLSAVSAATTHAPLYADTNQLLQQLSLLSSSWSLSLSWSKRIRVNFISTTLGFRHGPISSLKTPSDQSQLRFLALLGPSLREARTILILRGWCWMWFCVRCRAMCLLLFECKGRKQGVLRERCFAIVISKIITFNFASVVLRQPRLCILIILPSPI